MTIKIICAIDKSNAIGKDGKLLYWLPNDLKRFKNLTLGCPVIMGRKTFESLPNGALKNRLNIVITHDKNWKADNVVVTHSIRDAISVAREKELFQQYPHEFNIYIIGGGSIYQNALPFTDILELTEIDNTSEDANIFFPQFKNMFEEVKREKHYKDDKHLYNYDFVTYKRIKK